MQYKKRFLHRIHTQFLRIGLEDFDEVKYGNIEDEYIELSLDALCCLPYLSNIKHLILTPGNILRSDLSLLNGIRIKSLMLDFYSYEIDDYTIDLVNFPDLELLFAGTQYCFCNAKCCTTLKTLIVQEWITEDLNWISDTSIMALKIISGKLKSLLGIRNNHNIVSLSISNQRYLSDVSDLNANHLESIEICGCNKIEIDTLPTLPDVRFIDFSGKQKIPNMNSILQLSPKLEWLLLDMQLIDGDLSMTSNLSHMVIFRNYKHYSLKDKQLPKTRDRFKSSFLPFHLEILPEAY